MENLCEFESFKIALQQAINLLTEENLKKRGLKEVSENVQKLKEFLTKILENDEIKNYNDLVEFVNSSRNLIKYKEFMGFLGKILDAVQLLKPSKRREFAQSKLVENLKRTGHDFLIEEMPPKNLENIYLKEVTEASATFILLEVAYALNSQSKNPLATLRRSMGDRLPEEYFSELISGWMIEDIIIQKLREKGIRVEQESVDKERTIKLVRPKSMGNYDIIAYVNYKNCEKYFFEVQRVGNQVTLKRDLKKFVTPLKKHKYEGGNSNNKIILLWFGKNIPDLKERDKELENKLIFIKNVKQNPDFSQENDFLIFSDLKSLINRSISWEKFKKISKDEFVEFIRNLN